MGFEMGFSGTEPARYRLGSSRRWTAGITSVALVIGLGLGFGLFYGNQGFLSPCEADECARAYYGNGCVNANGAAGVWLLTFVLPAGIYGVGWLVGELGLLAALSQKVVPKVGLVMLTAVLAGSAAATFVKVAQPATIWLPTNDPFTAMAGSGLSVLLLLLAVAAFCVTRAAIFRGAVSTRVSAINAHVAADSSPLLPAAGVATAAVTAALPDLYPAGARRNLPWIAVLMAFLALQVFLTACFSAVWNYSFHSYSAHNAAESLFYHNYPSTGGARFKFKLYLDVVAYYGYVAAVVVVAAAAHLNPAFNALLCRRTVLSFPGWRRANGWNPFAYGVSTGEMVLVLSWLTLVAWWVWYFGWHNERITSESHGTTVDVTPSGYPACGTVYGCPPFDPADPTSAICENADPHPSLQWAARLTGQLATFLISFTLYPAARNSIWVHTFGIGHDQMLRYHRTLGGLAWVAVTVHMVLWFVKFALEGNFWHNLRSVAELKINDHNIHYDNFTIPLVTAAWVGLTAMLAIAVFARRKNYELFYYAHQFAGCFLVASVIHAWSFWYYAGGGATLYAVDRVIRLIRRAPGHLTVRITAWPGVDVTELVLPAGTVRHHGGQFAWINIPAVSEHEWHPFTIASAPSAAELSFHIKAMGGPETFTGKLLAFAAHCEAQGTPEQVVRVDGPYGRGPYLTEYETALMVCGGIGVTPMISQLAELYAAARSGTIAPGGRSQRQVRLRKVHLVWSVRDTGLLALYRDLLESIVLAAPGGGDAVVGGIAFEVSIHCTRDCANDVGALAKHVKRGRPEFQKLLAHHAGSKGRISVSVCGPDPMIAGLAAAAADTPNCDFHREIFHY